ncbi:MAG: DUF692 domain-containing protein [Bdellovibrionota bacterium]
MTHYNKKKPITYGVGVEWSFELEDSLFENLDKFSCFELIPENFFKQGDDFLDKLAKLEVPTVIHGVELSIGSYEPIKKEHFERIKEISERVNCIGVSEHLAMTESNGVEIGQLTPLNWSNELADRISEKIDYVMNNLSVPFSIENVTNRFVIPDTELSETDFINKILANTGCGFLIDLNNIDTNAYNYGFDPYKWMDSINYNSITSVHLAGGVFDEEGVLLDSHSAPVRERVWDLYTYLTNKIIPEVTIVEWTDHCPGLQVLLKDADRANQILNNALYNQNLTSNYIPQSYLNAGGIANES